MGPRGWCGEGPPSAGEPIGRSQGEPSTSGWSEDRVDGMISRREGGCVEGNGELGAGVATDHGGRDAGISDSEFLDDVDRRKGPSREAGDEVIRPSSFSKLNNLLSLCKTGFFSLTFALH